MFLVEYRIRSDGFPFAGGRLCGREATLPCAAVVMGGYPTGGLHTRTARGQAEGEHAEDLPHPS